MVQFFILTAAFPEHHNFAVNNAPQTNFQSSGPFVLRSEKPRLVECTVATTFTYWTGQCEECRWAQYLGAGKGWELYRSRPLPRPSTPAPAPPSSAAQQTQEKKRNRPSQRSNLELSPPQPRHEHIQYVQAKCSCKQELSHAEALAIFAKKYFAAARLQRRGIGSVALRLYRATSGWLVKEVAVLHRCPLQKTV